MKINRMIVCVALMLISVGMSARTEKTWIQGSVGKLAAVVQVPDGLAEGEKCPVVILMHGFMGNKDGMMEKVAGDMLAQQGIASVKFDFNGHGESEGEYIGFGLLERYDCVAWAEWASDYLKNKE